MHAGEHVSVLNFRERERERDVMGVAHPFSQMAATTSGCISLGPQFRLVFGAGRFFFDVSLTTHDVNFFPRQCMASCLLASYYKSSRTLSKIEGLLLAELTTTHYNRQNVNVPPKQKRTCAGWRVTANAKNFLGKIRPRAGE